MYCLIQKDLKLGPDLKQIVTYLSQNDLKLGPDLSHHLQGFSLDVLYN